MKLSKPCIFAASFFLLIICSYCSTPDKIISSHEIEKQSLLSFKQSLLDPLNKLSSWNARVDCCMWEGVICNNLTGNVVELHLSHCGLANSEPPLFDVNIILTNLATLDLSSNSLTVVPKWIFQLSSLIFLDLSNNSFEGPIPTLANCEKLQHVDLHNNHFNSTIPDWLYSCENLKYVNLGRNNLQGNISNAIANLTSLTTLDLSSNELSGEIPKEIASLCKIKVLSFIDNRLQGNVSFVLSNMSECFLSSVEYLDLSLNQLSGLITPQIGEFKSLHTLYLNANSLSGIIPSNIGNLSSLEYLDLGANSLSGDLPESIGQLLNLKELYYSDNKLEGIVSETHFARLSKLTVLSASRNRLTWKVSSLNSSSQFNLEALQLGSWNVVLGSQIFSWLETQRKSISVLDLSCTGISGYVPSWVWSIHSLNLSHNQLQGEIPVIDSRKRGISYPGLIYLSSNNFSGPLPRLGKLVAELDLSNNSFSGGLSDFLCDISNQTYGLKVLHLGGNRLSGQVPNCWRNWPLLQVLNLCNNSLSGRIPSSIGYLANLLSLNLCRNKFSGHIPFSIQNCTQLLKIDIADNDLDGNIRTWDWTSLMRLKFLILQSNKLSGEINPTICQLSSLQILDLSNNSFSGVIPMCIDNFTAMATKRGLEKYVYGFAILESASIGTKGSSLQYDTFLSLVSGIDLSGNNLSGNIPNEITSLVELKSLNLSGNHLTGTIPDNIGNLKQLESLDFSRNSLAGEIPSSFKYMSSLSYLNLSCNNLTGRIPESTQLQGFNESSFNVNNLCGPPLKVSCSNEDKVPGAEDQDEEGEIEWLYIFLSLGYSVGLSAVLTAFFLKKSWWEVYCKSLQIVWDSVYVFSVVKWRMLTREVGRN
ncbi:receptor-like protein [Striga asiatica]|uniref:Receptor-like protein n=1 Tax=Striga asiatica TaxID=4170 RepID=A0A5A7Q3D6_STRAF|nr:receptor-like protein [Striga asiatica]